LPGGVGPARRSGPRRHGALRRLPGGVPPGSRPPASQRLAGERLRPLEPPGEPGVPPCPGRPAGDGGEDRRGRRGRALRPVPQAARPGLAAGRRRPALGSGAMSSADDPRFPIKGRSADDLLSEIRAGRGDDAQWRAGRTFSLVYNPADPELERLQEAVAHEYLHANYLTPFAFPSLLKMEQEVVAFANDLFGTEGGVGKLTSGGTESIFLAVQVARE